MSTRNDLAHLIAIMRLAPANQADRIDVDMLGGPIADAAIESGWRHVGRVEQAARQIVARTSTDVGTHYADCHLYHLPCFAVFVLDEIGES